MERLASLEVEAGRRNESHAMLVSAVSEFQPGITQSIPLQHGAAVPCARSATPRPETRLRQAQSHRV